MLKLVDIAGLDNPDPIAVNSPNQAFAWVREGKADFACVAIENSVEGAVTATHDAFTEGAPLQVYYETTIQIAFAIMARGGAALSDIKTLSTHPVAHAQIRQWLKSNLPGVEYIPAASNGAGAQAVANREADAAAAAERAAEIYGLDVVATNVADVPGATTRFVLVGPAGEPTPPSARDCTSMIFTLPNEPGTLVGALQELASRGVDMSRIESRPTRKKFRTYRFHVDLVGHISDPAVAEAVEAIKARSEDFVFVGSWPREN